jgi:hypothetical protein
VRGNVDDDEARKSTPSLGSYLCAWVCVVASVAASALYLLSFGSSLGVRASRPVSKSNLQPDFNVSVCDRLDARSSVVLRELDESNRSVQKSAESTSIWPR